MVVQTDEAVPRTVDGNHRMAALSLLMDAFSSDVVKDGRYDDWNRAFARWLVDALLTSDADGLERARIEIRNCARAARASEHAERLMGVLGAFGELASAASDRAEQQKIVDHLDPTSWAAKMLLAIDDEPGASNTRLAEVLGVGDASQVSRSGRALLDKGLAVSAHLGRHLAWSLTPRGERVVESLRHRVGQTSAAEPEQSPADVAARMYEFFGLPEGLAAELYTTPGPLERSVCMSVVQPDSADLPTWVRGAVAADRVVVFANLDRGNARELFGLDEGAPVAVGLADRLDARHSPPEHSPLCAPEGDVQNVVIIDPAAR